MDSKGELKLKKKQAQFEPGRSDECADEIKKLLEQKIKLPTIKMGDLGSKVCVDPNTLALLGKILIE